MKTVILMHSLLSLGLGLTYASSTYTITDLGTLYSGTSRATGLNNNGDVVGTILGSDYSKPFLYSSGSMQDLGTLGGSSGASTGINDSGQVVGWAKNSLGEDRAFSYSNGVMVDLNVSTGSNYSSAINNSGQISGYGPNGNYVFRYTNTSTVDIVFAIDNGGGRSIATSINSSGQIAGFRLSPGKNQRDAIQYSTDLTSVMDLGVIQATLGGGHKEGQANGMNDNGLIVGEYAGRAFLYPGTNQFLIDLGKITDGRTYATDVNNLSQIVGSSASYAFIYENGTMLDLNLLIDPSEGWTLVEASAINDLGQIVGYGINEFGQERAFLLSPVPEPCSIFLVFISISTFLVRKR